MLFKLSSLAKNMFLMAGHLFLPHPSLTEKAAKYLPKRLMKWWLKA